MRAYVSSQALDKGQSAEVNLRRLAKIDKEKVCVWMTSPVIIRHSFVVGGPYAAKELNAKAFAEHYFNCLITDDHRQTYAILCGQKIIGTIGIKDINGTHSADCFIDIGEENYRGRGFGQKALSKLLDIAFYSIGLTHLFLDVLEFNRAAIKLYESLGFVSQGYTMWHFDDFGLYWQVLRMRLTKHNWLNRGSGHV